MNNKTDFQILHLFNKFYKFRHSLFNFTVMQNSVFTPSKTNSANLIRIPYFDSTAVYMYHKWKLKPVFWHSLRLQKRFIFTSTPNPYQLGTQAYQNCNAVIKRCTFILNVMNITSPQENKWLPPSFTVNVVVARKPIWQKVIPHAILDNDTLL